MHVFVFLAVQFGSSDHSSSFPHSLLYQLLDSYWFMARLSSHSFNPHLWVLMKGTVTNTFQSGIQEKMTMGLCNFMLSNDWISIPLAEKRVLVVRGIMIQLDKQSSDVGLMLMSAREKTSTFSCCVSVITDGISPWQCVVRNQGVYIWCQYTSELIDVECLPMCLPSLRLSWCWEHLDDENRETNSRFYRIGNNSSPFCRQAAILELEHPSCGLLSSAPLLWGGVPRLHSCPWESDGWCLPTHRNLWTPTHPNMHTHTNAPQTPVGRNKKMNEACLLIFLLVLPTLQAVSSECFVLGTLWGVTELWPKDWNTLTGKIHL